MGPIASFLQGIDKSKQMAAEAQQTINMCKNMIQIRFKAFQSDLNIPIGQVQKLPAKFLIGAEKKMSINVSKGHADIISSLSNIVNGFAAGKIADSIVNILDAALTVLLGSYSAGYNETQDYIIVTNIIGGIFRIDYLVVQQVIEAKGLQEITKNVFGSYLIITSIDKEHVKDDNLYRVLVDRQFPDFTIDQKLLLVKLTQGQELTADQLAEIQKLPFPTAAPQKNQIMNEIVNVQPGVGPSTFREQAQFEVRKLANMNQSMLKQQDNMVRLNLRIKQSKFRIGNLKQMAADQQSKSKLKGSSSDEDEKPEEQVKPKLITT